MTRAVIFALVLIFVGTAIFSQSLPPVADEPTPTVATAAVTATVPAAPTPAPEQRSTSAEVATPACTELSVTVRVVSHRTDTDYRFVSTSCEGDPLVHVERFEYRDVGDDLWVHNPCTSPEGYENIQCWGLPTYKEFYDVFARLTQPECQAWLYGNLEDGLLPPGAGVVEPRIENAKMIASWLVRDLETARPARFEKAGETSRFSCFPDGNEGDGLRDAGFTEVHD